jgi:hypothetical protein
MIANLRWRGLIIAVAHLALVSSLALKYANDRRTLPRVWVRTAPYDPDLPIRGRYVRIQIETEVDPAVMPDAHGVSNGFQSEPARLAVDNDQLWVRPDPKGDRMWIAGSVTDRPGYRLGEPLAYFIPEHVDDPSRRPEGEELWVEVSVPRHGPPRPIRLGVKRGGELTPLEL